MNKRRWKKKQNCDIWEQCPICLLKTKVQTGNGHGRVIFRRKMCPLCFQWLQVKPVVYSDNKPQWTKTYREHVIFDTTLVNGILKYEN